MVSRRPVAKSCAGNQAERGFDLCGIHGIAQVVSGSIGNESDLFGIALAVWPWPPLIEKLANQADNIEIAPLVAAADVVTLAGFPFCQKESQRGDVIVYMQPIADVLPVP